jgi:hypothetical protein
VQLAEGTVELELLLGQNGEFGEVAAALGFGDLGAEVALAVLDGALVDLLDGAPDFKRFGRLDFGQKGLGQQRALGRIFDYIHGVAGLAAGKGLQAGIGAKMLKPSRLLGQGLGRDAAGVFILGVVDGEGAQEDALDFSQSGGSRLNVVAAAEGGLAQFFAQHG